MPVGMQKKQWVGSETISLMQETGFDDPIDAISYLVRTLLEDTKQTRAPINLHIVASAQGITEIKTMPLDVAAILLPTQTGLQILVNLSDSTGRRNFSIAHEICHTLFPTYRNNPIKKIDKFVGQFNVPQEEEYLCDIGASNLLLPPFIVARKVACLKSCLDSILTVADNFQSSLESAAIAWMQLCPEPCAVLFLEEGLTPSQLKRKAQLVLPGLENDFRLEPELRIKLACKSEAFPWFLPRHKSARRDGVIHAAFKNNCRTEGMDFIDLQGKARRIYAESICVPYRIKGKAINRLISYIVCLDEAA